MSERLYSLLPSHLRVRDAEQGEPLRALLRVIETEANRVETDIAGLYDDWFIETCADWVIPYIGDLLGVRPLNPTGPGSRRAYVANTLAYRRRKGTAAVLEQLARDVTGWPAHAVEFFELLGTTQHLNHVRAANFRTPDFRDSNRLELLDGPFERAARTAEVRRIVTEGGRYNIPNVGLFLWRLQSFAVESGEARTITNESDGALLGFTFNPLGLDAPLFNQPQTEREITHLAEEINVPGPLRRRPLYDEFEARRKALEEGRTPDTNYFGEQPILRVWAQATTNDPLVEFTPEEIVICCLDDWRQPVPQNFTRQNDGSNYATGVAVDPVLGRLTFPTGVEPQQVLVSYSYGFSSDLGGGPYPRLAPAGRAVTWQVGVSRDKTAVGAERIFADLGDAIDAWNNEAVEGTAGAIAVMDSRSYGEPFPAIVVKAGCQLRIIAADWPIAPGDTMERRVGALLPEGVRPHLAGDLTVQGVASANPGELILEGLLIEGKLTVAPAEVAVANSGNLGSLRLLHCTLVPDNGGLVVPQDNKQLGVAIERSIVGDVLLDAPVPQLAIADSVVDGRVLGLETAAELDGVTVFGTTELRRLDASDCLFVSPVTVTLRQEGCVRFCFVPLDASLTPRRYRCQPDLALEQRAAEVAEALHLDPPPDLTPAETALIKGRVRPVFTSSRLADAGYAQLGLTCALEISAGAEDGSEMGAFRHLQQTQRAANLRAVLPDYLRFGLEAGLFFVT